MLGLLFISVATPRPILISLSISLILSRGRGTPNPLASSHSAPNPIRDSRDGRDGSDGDTRRQRREEWYWDDRYLKEQATFDWYQRYEAVAPLLRLLLRSSHRILLVGCGNSRVPDSTFGEKTVNDDYEQVVNIDISSVVIRAMQSKYSHLPHLQYMKMDVRDMSAFEDNSFDAVIDKGTLDSIMCGNDSQVNSTKMLKEVHRVLKERGIYIMPFDVLFWFLNIKKRIVGADNIWRSKLSVGFADGSQLMEHKHSCNSTQSAMANPNKLQMGCSWVRESNNSDNLYIRFCDHIILHRSNIGFLSSDRS
ncbi:methyltransferase-like protein 13 [Carex littledalei]|uniref:Methyltransferase-like protein 13 n=1 Tax=Carex littledalei TaxID=544730 RepID=A0A833R8Y0_9POAL|nr:methyltransferase-like protein 13 [Carex littledalei]